jgi:hypothetical protein
MSEFLESELTADKLAARQVEDLWNGQPMSVDDFKAMVGNFYRMGWEASRKASRPDYWWGVIAGWWAGAIAIWAMRIIGL